MALPSVNKLHGHNDIFQAEAMAIKIAGLKNLSDLNIEVYTDSQAVIRSLQKSDQKWAKIPIREIPIMESPSAEIRGLKLSSKVRDSLADFLLSA